MGICLYLETAWFLHFICGRSVTIFFFNLCLLTGEAWMQAIFFLIFFVCWEAGTAWKQSLWLPRGVCVRVRAGGNGRGPGLGSTGQLLEVGDESLLMQAVSQQLTMAINHYCVVQKSLVFPPTPLLCSASIRSHFFFPFHSWTGVRRPSHQGSPPTLEGWRWPTFWFNPFYGFLLSPG